MRHRTATLGTVIAGVAVVATAISGPALAAGSHQIKKKPVGTTIATTSTSLGTVVASSKGRVMYLFATDKHGASTCTGACLSVWPRVTSAAKPVAGKGISAKHLTLTAKGQVRYYDHPLYYFTGDTKPGKHTGEGDNSFYVVSTHGKAIKKPVKKPTGAVVDATTVGADSVITDAADGRTLYELSDETDGTSPTFFCTGGCASIWIPLVTNGAPTATGDAQAAELGTVTRPDGTTQVTYNHHPVYTYVGDSKAGTVAGEGANDPPGHWYDIAPGGTPNLT